MVNVANKTAHFFGKHLARMVLRGRFDLERMVPDVHISYSQQGEDLAIQRYFQNLEKGFYVDVGAFHPITYSNTYKFYKAGWNGINIEPNPDSSRLFQKHRKRDINVNCGISASAQTLSYYKFNHGALNTFDEEHAKTWEVRPGFQIEQKLEIDTYTLSAVLAKCLPDNQRIDFMSIDAEGFDLEVVQSNDWETYRPRLLLVEENVSRGLAESRIVTFLAEQDYALWTISGGTILFEDSRR